MDRVESWARPRAMRTTKVGWLHALAGLVFTQLVILSLVLAAIPMSVFERHGARRSTELVRQERLAEIEAALAEDAGGSPAPTEAGQDD